MGNDTSEELVTRDTREEYSPPTRGPNRGLTGGPMDFFNHWFPDEQTTKWLLLCGALDPPTNIQISDRRSRVDEKGGSYLAGPVRDLDYMTDALKRNNLEIFDALYSFRAEKEDALKKIKNHFHACKSENKKPVIYYSGHGQRGNGNWCYADGTISIEEVVALIPRGCCPPFIICDCCYSGNWANYCSGREGFDCLAACGHDTTALDIHERKNGNGELVKGGELTLYMTGKIVWEELKRTPVYDGYCVAWNRCGTMDAWDPAWKD